jgi:NAD-dependent deacetylase
VLARWTRERPGTTLITQNVDGLHERAGADPILRLHGSIWQVRCWTGCEGGRLDWLEDTVPLPTLPPRCPHCAGLVRPGVVWFGEPRDPVGLSRGAEASHCDVFLVVGTSAFVYPAAGLVHVARHAGAHIVEINPDLTGTSNLAHVSIRAPADEALSGIDAWLQQYSDPPAP